MIGYVDIKGAVVDVLEKLQIDVIASEIRSGFDKPAFFIKLLPIKDNDFNEYVERNLIVVIHYFSREKTDLENLKMLDTLTNLFRTTLKVKNKVLTLGEKRHEIVDNVLHFKFNLQFTVGTTEIYDSDKGYTELSIEKMDELYLNEEGNNGATTN